MPITERLVSTTNQMGKLIKNAVPAFLFEMAGREKRICIWTGPRLEGADNRLPLPTRDEKRRHASLAGSSTTAVPSKRNRANSPGASRKDRKPRRPDRGRLTGYED
jgi:hypothetical protein